MIHVIDRHILWGINEIFDDQNYIKRFFHSIHYEKFYLYKTWKSI